MTAPAQVRPRRRRAFTIAEVMVGASVMALAISTAITTMQQAYLALDSARNLTLAGQILQGQVERLRLKSWETIVSYQGATQPARLEHEDYLRLNYPAIAARYTLTREVANAGADMKEITFTIAWRGFDGRRHSRYYKTYYGRNGLYDYFYSSM